VRLVVLEEVPAGAELAREVPGALPGGPPLMCAGLRINPLIAARAAAAGVGAVWVNDDLGEGIEPPAPLPREVRERSLHAIAAAHDCARRAHAAQRPVELTVLTAVANTAELLAEAIRVTPGDAADPAPRDPHGYWHALRVATLGLVLGGRRVGNEQRDPRRDALVTALDRERERRLARRHELDVRVLGLDVYEAKAQGEELLPHD
jgi:hypothetical protein